MALLVTVLLSVGLALLALVGLAIISDRVDRVSTRIALFLFRNAIEETERHRDRRERTLQSIHATTTYPVYASKTLLYSALVGIAGSLIGVYLLWWVLTILTSLDKSLREAVPPALHFLIPGSGIGGLSLGALFVLLLLCSAIFGTIGGIVTYYGRWEWIERKAKRRAVLIDESVARTIAFIYALSRSGMVYPEIMRTVGRNRKSFGESAEELGVVVKDMDLFGADLITALQRIGDRTPSDQFADFAENFANVLRTGRNVSEYLREQYDQYQEERIENQERLLDLFTALGEGYVAGLVAGPLFFLTILLIFGLLTGGMLDILHILVYGLIPLANIAFVGYLDSISGSLTTYQVPIRRDIPSRNLSVRSSESQETGVERADGGIPATTEERMNRIRLAAYNRFRRVHETVLNPMERVVEKPSILLYVTVPITLLFLVVRGGSMVQSGTVDPRVLDDILIQATLFLVGTFAIAQELYRRRLDDIEAAIPDLLDRLASTNEAGMTFTAALKRIDRSDLGGLDDEVSKLLADVEWGARTEKALHRFSSRIESSTVARIVALITNAMTASGNLGPVIRIASDEAREDRRLKRKRRQEMFLYVVIIYLSFGVFMGIGIALQTILLPAIPSAEQIGVGVGGSGAAPGVGVDIPINPVQGAEKELYTLVLYHAAMIQAVCSGFIAGQMGEGDLRDGAKHVVIMLGVAYGLFLFFGG